MLKDYCIICISLKTDKLEVATAYKREQQEIVVIKKINKLKCSKSILSIMKTEFFMEDCIEEIEDENWIIRVEENSGWRDNIVVNSIKNSDDGVMFFKGTSLIYINDKQRGMLGEIDVSDFNKVESHDIVKEVNEKISYMNKHNLNRYSGKKCIDVASRKKLFGFEINRIQNGEQDSLMVLCKDRTKEFIAEKSLITANQRLNAVLESSHSGIFEIDEKDNNSIWISYDIYNMLGYEMAKEILSNDLVKTVMHPEDYKNIFLTLKDETLDRKILCRELRIKELNGEFRWFSLVAYAIKLDDNTSKIIGSLTDIHDKKIVSLNLKKSERELEEERELNKMITEFFNNISHDFKTPLNLITNSLKLLKNSFNEYFDQEKQGTRYFDIIQQNCYRLIKLVNNLLDISRIESGFYSLSLNNGNIVNIIEDTTLSVKEYTKNKGIELVFDTDFEEEIICYDNEKIERIMLNLLSNSIKFTENGGKIFVGMTKQNNFVKVCIKDTGIGIPKNKLKRIFERFEQAHEMSSRLSGTGIGLALVKSLVEMHEGKITINSCECEGTEVSFILPIKTIKIDNKKEFMESKFDIDKVFVELSDV